MVNTRSDTDAHLSDFVLDQTNSVDVWSNNPVIKYHKSLNVWLFLCRIGIKRYWSLW